MHGASAGRDAGSVAAAARCAQSRSRSRCRCWHPGDIFTASLLGAEAVLVLSQTCWFFKLLLKGAERRRVRGALQLVCFDYVRKYITKGLACNLYREQGRTHDLSASEVAWRLMWMPPDAAYIMLTGMS